MHIEQLGVEFQSREVTDDFSTGMDITCSKEALDSICIKKKNIKQNGVNFQTGNTLCNKHLIKTI